jgi:hypothetical protein
MSRGEERTLAGQHEFLVTFHGENVSSFLQVFLNILWCTVKNIEHAVTRNAPDIQDVPLSRSQERFCPLWSQ